LTVAGAKRSLSPPLRFEEVSTLRRARPGGFESTASLLALSFVCLATAPTAALAQESASLPPGHATPADESPTPKLQIRGFGNIDFLHHGDGTPNNFAVGELDFFTTSQLSEDVSVLAEVVFEPGDNDEPLIDIERYQIKYSPSDLFNVAFGRMHSALGYWNQTFHHGAWFQTTAFRPEIYHFEDEGGVLPVHEVGVQVSGTKALGVPQLEYNVSVTNGRGIVRTEVETFRDSNPAKAVNLWLGLTPRPRAGLKLGGALRFDMIPPNPANEARKHELKERIVSGFLAFERGRQELLAEVIRMRHEDAPNARTYTTLGYYVQAAYRFGRLKPYYRFDSVDHGAGDPFYGGGDDDIRRHTLGLRADPWIWVCIKLEFSHNDPAPGESFGAGALQVAFTF